MIGCGTKNSDSGNVAPISFKYTLEKEETNDEKAAAEIGFEYTDKNRLFAESDIISLHCPLTKDTRYIIGEDSLRLMKSSAYIINTSRGKLIDSEALLRALREKRIGAAGLDVYEEEADFFYEDRSGDIIDDETLALLISMPNVIITSHQAFLTEEALNAIAQVTLSNAEEFFSGAEKLTNEVVYGM